MAKFVQGFGFSTILLSVLFGAFTFGYPTWAGLQEQAQGEEFKKPGEKYEFTVFPNPFITATRFRITPGTKNITEMRVYDLLGRTIARRDISILERVTSYTLDLSETDPGVYFCTVYNGKMAVETKKLIKVRN